MEISSLMLYFITRLDAISGFFIVTMIIMFIVTLVTFGIWTDTADDDLKMPFFVFLIIFFFSAIGFIATPDTKEAVTILYLPKVVANEEIQQLPNNALKLINGKLEEWIKEPEDNK